VPGAAERADAHRGDQFRAGDRREVTGEKGLITRRAALRGAAAAGAMSLARPALGRAATTGPVFSRWVGTVAGESAVIAAPRRFALVGVEWSGPATVGIELRTRVAGDRAWSPWAVASVLGHGPDRGGSRSGHFGEPIWTGPADDAQLRASSPVDGARLHFVASSAPGGPAHVAQAFPPAQPLLDAGPGQPPIIARSAWAQGHAPPSNGPFYGTVKLAFVHHSESPNGYGAGEVPSMLMSIFTYHRYVRGFFDIGYNFAVDAFGRIWEARAGGIDLPVIGAHAGGYNEESTGMVVLGSFSSVVPSPAAIDALERLLAWKLSLHGLPALGRVTVQVAAYDAFYTPFPPGAQVSLPRVAGHRDGDQTSCPGDAFYARLPSIRPQVAGLAGSPARLGISGSPATVNSGAPVALSGRLTDLATGSPLAGEPIELQLIARGAEQTIATLTTGTDGSWSATFTPVGNSLVRALHRQAPAVVSDVVLMAVAPVLTLTLAGPAPPVEVVGTVSPAVFRNVTVGLYRVVGARRLLIASKRVPAGSSGQFAARFRPRRAGRYVVIARTAASARYVAGVSGAVTLDIP
jgi:hypothetical protein